MDQAYRIAAKHRTGRQPAAPGGPARRLVRSAVIASLLVGLTACGGDVQTRGHLVEDRFLADLDVGTSTVDQVLSVLGSPTTVAPFDQQTWYYIGHREEQTAFFRPEVLERRVVIVRFDDTGILSELGERTLEDGEELEMVERETPSLGREMTFLEQMLGNIGRFNPTAQ